MDNRWEGRDNRQTDAEKQIDGREGRENRRTDGGQQTDGL
jgi:hypothetical protein